MFNWVLLESVAMCEKILYLKDSKSKVISTKMGTQSNTVQANTTNRGIAIIAIATIDNQNTNREYLEFFDEEIIKSIPIMKIGSKNRA